MLIRLNSGVGLRTPTSLDGNANMWPKLRSVVIIMAFASASITVAYAQGGPTGVGGASGGSGSTVSGAGPGGGTGGSGTATGASDASSAVTSGAGSTGSGSTTSRSGAASPPLSGPDAMHRPGPDTSGSVPR